MLTRSLCYKFVVFSGDATIQQGPSQGLRVCGMETAGGGTNGCRYVHLGLGFMGGAGRFPSVTNHEGVNGSQSSKLVLGGGLCEVCVGQGW